MLSIGTLVTIILLLSYISAGYLNKSKSNTENILKANYNTLEYTRKMLVSLELFPQKKGMDDFDKYLTLQQKNITEKGEQEVTAKLGEAYYLLKNQPDNDSLETLIRQDLFLIMQMNMDAIRRKSELADKIIDNAMGWLTIFGLISITAAIAIWIVFPPYIAKPIKQLNEGIQKIIEKKYSHRISINRNDEFSEVAATFNLMAARLEEYENSNLSRILFEKKRIETIINGIQDPLIVLDESKRVIFINKPALQALNISEEGIKGKFAPEISVKNDLLRSLIKDLMFSVKDENNNIKIPVEIFMGGKKNYFEKESLDISYTPIAEKESKLLGHVILLKNITGLKERDFAKTNFIATISHELKTPISAIKMSLQLLANEKSGKLNNDQKQLTKSIEDDTNRLLKITSELLNMSQLETGNIQLNIQAASPKKIIDQANDATRFIAEQKHIDYEIDIESNLPMVRVDAEKTIWVLTNFLTNAIKYSPEQSSIIISVKRNSNAVRFSVTDVGKGIDPKYHDRLFERFFQVPGSPRTGTGLGLSISKEFIEAQGGHIGVESEIGKGSTFYFEV